MNDPKEPQNQPAPFPPAGRRQGISSILATAGTIVVLILLSIGVYLLFRPRLSAGLTASEPRTFPPITLTEQAKVNSLGWANKAAGVAHIPVDRAIQIIATQGFPTLQPLPTVAGTPQTTAAPSGSPGEALFTQLGCSGCHGPANSALAPTLHGIYGKPVQLEGGQMVTADDAYIRESILDPKAKVVKGFQPVMPSFQGRVTDEQINQIIAYIKSLGGS